MAEFISLYSGSSGNSSVVRCGQRYLIVDMGKGVRTTSAALKALGLAVSDCDGILVTHEHSDHVKGLSTFLKKNTLPVYGAAATLDFLDSNGIVPASCELHELEGREEDVGAFGVQSFPTSHDVPCVGYRIHTPDGKTMTIATDLGVLTPPVHEALSGCDLVALESNYDLHMLRSGPYPYYLRARIESTRGHLSNDECAAKLLELIQGGEEKESDIIARMNSAKLVIFDDLGAERNTDYALEKIYNIIDSRYRRKLPMLLTTNLTIDEMKDEEDRRYSRIYDRIFETCYSMQFTGPSWRKKEASRRFTEMEKLFDID